MSARDEILLDVALTVDNEGNILQYETLQFEDEVTVLSLKAKIPYKYADQIEKFYVVMDGFTPVFKIREGETIEEDRLMTDEQAEDYQARRVERVKNMNILNRISGGNEKPEIPVDENFNYTDDLQPDKQMITPPGNINSNMDGYGSSGESYDGSEEDEM